MEFLKNFFRNVFHEEALQPFGNSFDHLTEDDLEAHLNIARYGDFTLTDAIRPSYDLKVVPQTGYRHDSYRDEQANSTVPVLMASVSSETVFETFMELLEPLGGEVDVVLETSHDRDGAGHVDMYREHIDLPVLKSILWDFEDMLTNDGCTGIAVMNPAGPLEVQFDEHKLLIAYGAKLSPFERILKARRIKCQDDMQFITEAEHVHSSSEEYRQEFQRLASRMGMDGSFC